MELKLIDDKGQSASTVAASDALFGREYNEALPKMTEAVGVSRSSVRPASD